MKKTSGIAILVSQLSNEPPCSFPRYGIKAPILESSPTIPFQMPTSMPSSRRPMASERLPCQILTSAPLFSCKVTQDLELYIYPFNLPARCAIGNSRSTRDCGKSNYICFLYIKCSVKKIIYLSKTKHVISRNYESKIPEFLLWVVFPRNFHREKLLLTQLKSSITM